MLNKEDFYSVVEKTPLVSVDFIIKNNGKILLGHRNNNPARGTYFTPGGVIFKDERVIDAISRVLWDELGIEYDLITSNIEFNGVFNHMYPNNFKDESFGTHYVCLSYIINLELPIEEYGISISDSQHDDIEWRGTEAIINANDVHPLVKEMINYNGK
jgi:colanic acid biosynthesis protein WcaH